MIVYLESNTLMVLWPIVWNTNSCSTPSNSSDHSDPSDWDEAYVYTSRVKAYSTTSLSY